MWCNGNMVVLGIIDTGSNPVILNLFFIIKGGPSLSLMAKREAHNLCDIGSNPVERTGFVGDVAEWFNAVDCKSIPFRVVGSNPTILKQIRYNYCLKLFFLSSYY